MAESSEPIEGLEKVQAVLKGLPEVLQARILAGAMKAGAEAMVEPLKAAAPVFTGHLEEGISARIEPKRQRFASVGDAVVSAVVWIRGIARRYWHLTEFGTVKMPARPWARPTFAREQGRAVEAVKAYVSKRVTREAKKLAEQGSAGG